MNMKVKYLTRKPSKKSFLVSWVFAVTVFKNKVIVWAHSKGDNPLKKFIRAVDGAPKPYLDEKQYRWCQNDAETPTPLAAENTAITGVVNCDVLRLRVNIANTGAKDAKVYLGLRYSDDGGVTWYSLGGAPDAPVNPHFEYQLSDFGIDGTTVTTLILTASDTAGVHIESVPTAELTIAVGTTVEFDFCIHCTTNASSYTTYLFKIVVTDSTGAYSADLDAYTTQPELTTGEIIAVVTKTKTYSSDVLLKKSDIVKTYSADALLKVILTKLYSADALLKKSDITKTYASDTLLKKSDIVKTYSADTRLVLVGTKTYIADAILKAIFAKTYSSDALLKKSDITKTYASDVLLFKSDITKTYTSDVLLKKFEIMKTYLGDTLLKKFDLEKTYVVDLCLKKTSIKTYSADCYLGIPLTLEEHDARVIERLDKIRANIIP